MHAQHNLELGLSRAKLSAIPSRSDCNVSWRCTILNIFILSERLQQRMAAFVDEVIFQARFLWVQCPCSLGCALWGSSLCGSQLVRMLLVGFCFTTDPRYHENARLITVVVLLNQYLPQHVGWIRPTSSLGILAFSDCCDLYCFARLSPAFWLSLTQNFCFSILRWSSVIFFSLTQKMHGYSQTAPSVDGFPGEKEILLCIDARGQSLALCVPCVVAWRLWPPCFLAQNQMEMPIPHCRCSMGFGGFSLLLHSAHRQVLKWLQNLITWNLLLWGFSCTILFRRWSSCLDVLSFFLGRSIEFQISLVKHRLQLRWKSWERKNWWIRT